jgi:hypothetical protein
MTGLEELVQFLGRPALEGRRYRAAGVNAKALSTHLGHSTVSITLDCYGHLMPGGEDEAADLLDAYLARAVDPEVRDSCATVDPPRERSRADVSGWRSSQLR